MLTKRTRSACLRILCLLALSTPIVLGAAEGEATLVLKFTDGAGTQLNATFKPDVTCNEGTIQLNIFPPDKFEGDATDKAGELLPRGHKGFGLPDVVEKALRGESLSFTIKPDGTAALKRGKRFDTNLKVTSPPRFDANPIKLTGQFLRTELRIGGPFRSGEPLTLEEQIQVDMIVRCP